MKIEIQCLCGRVLSADASRAGREVICPACQRPHIVPEVITPVGGGERPSSRGPEWMLVAGAVTSVLVIVLALMWALLEHPAGGGGTGGEGGGGEGGKGSSPYAGRFDRGMGTKDGPPRDMGGGGTEDSDQTEDSEEPAATPPEEPVASKDKTEPDESQEPPGTPPASTAPTPPKEPEKFVEAIPEPKIAFTETTKEEPEKAPWEVRKTPEEKQPAVFGRAKKWIGSKTARKSYGRRGDSNFARKKGATPESEAAVERGLAWLAAVQYEDGHWNSNGEKEEMEIKETERMMEKKMETWGAGMTEIKKARMKKRMKEELERMRKRRRNTYDTYSLGYTSLGTLAFLGAGYTHKHDCKYKQTVARSVHWLVEKTRGKNFTFDNVYCLGLAGMAMSEAYGMTSDRTLRKPAQNVIDRLVSLMGKNGGYSYHGPGGDNHQTSFAVMAVKSAMMAELKVPPYAKRRLLGYYDACLAEDGTTGYHGSSGSSPGAVCTAVGLFVRMFLGVHPKKERCRRIAGVLNKAGPQLESPLQVYDGTYGMFQMGGKYWPRWNKRFRDAVIEQQIRLNKYQGYWKRSGWCQGNVDATCFYLMSLEVYYRFLPVNE